jgi:predicted glycosyltransferase
VKVLIVVTHLLGTGHLARVLTLSRAYRAAGHDVTVASGGMPAPQLDQGDAKILQLPAVRSDGVNFSSLLDGTGAVVTDRLIGKRITCLVDQLATEPPDILVTELFPFGRRILRTEFEALLQAARSLSNRPLICASIRDILAPPSTSQKAAMADRMVEIFYDAVLVHSDHDVTPLDLSWPVSDTLATKLHYTGFVAPSAPKRHPEGIGTGEVIVSAGGGDVGTHIFASAIAAAWLDPDRRWRILVGGTSSSSRIADLNRTAPANVIVERARPDFRQILHQAAASVSMCGYNTALDILQTGCPAVFIPFDAGSEVEQGLRATSLEELSGVKILRSADLSPEHLLQALSDLTQQPRRAPLKNGFDGADETVKTTTRLYETMA